MSDLEWIETSDRLPIDYENCTMHETLEVLIVSGGITEFCEFSCGPLPKPWFKFEDYHLAYISHWMGKPLPPTDTRG